MIQMKLTRSPLGPGDPTSPLGPGRPYEGKRERKYILRSCCVVSTGLCHNYKLKLKLFASHKCFAHNYSV